MQQVGPKTGYKWGEITRRNGRKYMGNWGEENPILNPT